MSSGNGVQLEFDYHKNEFDLHETNVDHELHLSNSNFHGQQQGQLLVQLV